MSGDRKRLSHEEAMWSFKLIYTLFKVRGFKAVLRLLPHSVDDLKKTFLCFELTTFEWVFGSELRGSSAGTSPVGGGAVEGRQSTASSWEVAYVLLTWLSLITLVPFDLDLFFEAAADRQELREGLAAAEGEVFEGGEGEPYCCQASKRLWDFFWTRAEEGVQGGRSLLYDDLRSIVRLYSFYSGTRPLGRLPSFTQRMVTLCYIYLMGTAVTRDAAAYSLASILTRFDHADDLGVFVSTFVRAVSNYDADQLELSECPARQVLHRNLIRGFYQTLVFVFQRGEVECLRAHASSVLDCCFFRLREEIGSEGDAERAMVCKGAESKRLSVKLLQWIVMAVVKPIKIKRAWHEKPRTYSLTLSPACEKFPERTSSSADAPESDAPPLEELVLGNQADIVAANSFVSEHLEAIVRLMLYGLRDRESVVRYSSAKGIARISSHLTRLLVDDVLDSLVALLDRRESSSTWHGCMLALAECTRRGVVPISRLVDFIPGLRKAFVFERRQGTFVVGDYVRDAACYVAWSIARSYDPSCLSVQPFLQGLVCDLFVVAVFDREVNCRRAAAAAYQELVGRLPSESIAHGIDASSQIHFFSVSSRTRCYLQFASLVAAYAEPYKRALVDHLVDHKLSHIDRHVRCLAAQALGSMLSIEDYDQYVPSVLKTLIPRALDSDPFARHGAILAVAESLFRLNALLCQQQNQKPNAFDPTDRVATASDPPCLTTYLGKELAEDVCNLPVAICLAKLDRGRGSEPTRVALSRLLEALFTLAVPFSFAQNAAKSDVRSRLKDQFSASRLRPLAQKNRPPSLQELLLFLQENLKSSSEELVQTSIQALTVLNRVYLTGLAEPQRSGLIANWISALQKETNPIARRAYALILGVLSPSTAGRQLKPALDCLVRATSNDGDESNDIETRKNAVVSITRLVCQLVEQKLSVQAAETPVDAHPIADALVRCLDDYTTNNQGDVGSKLRETAILSLKAIIDKQVHQNASQGLPPVHCLSAEATRALFYRLVKQTVERIDRTRQVAGSALEFILRLAADSGNSGQQNAAPLDLISLIPHLRELRSRLEAHKDNRRRSERIVENDSDWASTAFVFPLVIPWLEYDEYRYWISLGLLRSVKEVDEYRQVIDEASSALIDYCKSRAQSPISGATAVYSVATTFVRIIRDCLDADLIVQNTWIILETLFASNCFDCLDSNLFSKFAWGLYQASRKALLRSATVKKLRLSVPIFMRLLRAPEEDPEVEGQSVRQLSLKVFLYFLGCSYPVIRRVAAKRLLDQLQAHPDIVANRPKLDGSLAREEDLDQIRQALTSLDSWTDETRFQGQRNLVGGLLGQSMRT
ncbi:tubulin-specific chaperone D-like [Schistocerca gregaria]|uniref:tubulin-specific chaperone D-like n=1 Tax=Schistocerca gregaria TaxID=7010 RepID=UPI00211E5BD8|nr:tubulin-specific chaperone D-like [Schistocerca gregaria]